MVNNQKKRVPLDRETWIILIVVCGGIVATFLGVLSGLSLTPPPELENAQGSSRLVSLAKVPLATGDEPIHRLFTQSGCLSCHTIPGIEGAIGREGPNLMLGLTAKQRLSDPNYHGNATTEREYIIESVLNPGAYVVPGYPDRVMPRWYGQKLSARALDKIANYLITIPELP